MQHYAVLSFVPFQAALDHFSKKSIAMRLSCTYLQKYTKDFPQPTHQKYIISDWHFEMDTRRSSAFLQSNVHHQPQGFHDLNRCQSLSSGCPPKKTWYYPFRFFLSFFRMLAVNSVSDDFFLIIICDYWSHNYSPAMLDRLQSEQMKQNLGFLMFRLCQICLRRKGAVI